MRLFIDTNIFLDLLLKRPAYQSVTTLLNAIAGGTFEGVILDITLINIFYVASKQHKDIKAFLEVVEQQFEIVGAGNSQVREALRLPNRDFEDALQYICAQHAGCDAVISNDKTFYSPSLPLFESETFEKEHLL